MTNSRRSVVDLFLASALGLFVELVFIRWVASELRIFSFYKNIALIAAYLGLGLGFILYRQERGLRSLFRVYLPMMIIIVGVVLGLGRTLISDLLLSNQFNAEEYIWAGSVTQLSPWILTLRQIALYGLLLGMFIALSLVFVPLGELIAATFSVFQPLRGYSINILGSLAGVLFYAAISFLGVPPVIWFLAAALGVVYFNWQLIPRPHWVAFVLSFLPVVMILLWPMSVERTIWSPYYRIDIQENRASESPDVLLGYNLSVNLAYHQRLVNLDPVFVAEHYDKAPDYFDAMQSMYDAIYTAPSSMDHVLVVGAGTGNDVAAAVRAGAQEVVAVEIDPMILRLGEEFHPEMPYANPSVVRVVEDARSFFTRTPDVYDVIVFGKLDSHALFSPTASARLDNFVYTLESLTRVRDLLSEDGVLALSFGVPVENEWIGLRIYRTLSEAFGHPPQVYEFPTKDILFLIGREAHREFSLDDPRLSARADYAYREDIRVTTDDWPYLYLRERQVPGLYWQVLLLLLILSAIVVSLVFPESAKVNLHFFFLGCAFFLIETKSITEPALLFGSTWKIRSELHSVSPPSIAARTLHFQPRLLASMM